MGPDSGRVYFMARALADLYGKDSLSQESKLKILGIREAIGRCHEDLETSSSDCTHTDLTGLTVSLPT
jgi:hypothetical protein